MKIQKLLSLALVAAFILSACCGDKFCESKDGPIISHGFTLNNFSKAEADSVIIKVYASSSNFSNPFDSSASHGQPFFTSDSTHWSLPYTGANPSFSDAELNVLLYFPKDSLSYKITNVTTVRNYCDQCRKIHEVLVTGYKVNGVADTILANQGTITIGK